MVYHVGLLHENGKAIFQFRKSIDYLSCEILKYYGKRETTKKAARERLRHCKDKTLKELREAYPHRVWKTVIVD